jgi:hypothetical protein
VFCRSANLCLALDEFGAVVSSTDPTGGTGAWQTRPLDPWCNDGTCDDSVTCPSTSFCLASGSNSVFTSLAPGSGEWAIDSPRLPAGSSPPAVSPQSCPGTHRCVGVNSNGDLLVSSSPARAWTTSSIAHQDVTDPAYGYSIVLGPTGVSCPSRSLCIAIDALGNVLVGKRRAAG